MSSNDTDRDSKPFLSGTQLAVIAGIGMPVLLIGGFVTGVLVLKRRRRRRRRGEGARMERIVGGWRELDDRALDLGRPLPSRATRREIATYLGSESARHSAVVADAAIFGPDEPRDDEVDDYWMSLDAAYDSLAADHSTFRRLRADLNPASLIRSFRGRVGRSDRRLRGDSFASHDANSPLHGEVPV